MSESRKYQSLKSLVAIGNFLTSEENKIKYHGLGFDKLAEAVNKACATDVTAAALRHHCINLEVADIYRFSKAKDRTTEELSARITNLEHRVAILEMANTPFGKQL